MLVPYKALHCATRIKNPFLFSIPADCKERKREMHHGCVLFGCRTDERSKISQMTFGATNMPPPSALSACKLIPTPNPSVFNASPGPLSIDIVPKTGNVAFVPPNCDVTDSSSTSVNPQKTPTTITFTVVAGQTYHLMVLFDIFPLSSTGILQESCTGHTELDQISSASNPEVYTLLA